MLCELWGCFFFFFKIKTATDFASFLSTAKWFSQGVEWASPGNVCFPTHITPINVSSSDPCKNHQTVPAFIVLDKQKNIYRKGEQDHMEPWGQLQHYSQFGRAKNKSEAEELSVSARCDGVKAPWDEFFLSERMRKALKCSAGLSQHPARALLQLQPCSQSSCALLPVQLCPLPVQLGAAALWFQCWRCCQALRGTHRDRVCCWWGEKSLQTSWGLVRAAEAEPLGCLHCPGVGTE